MFVARTLFFFFYLSSMDVLQKFNLITLFVMKIEYNNLYIHLNQKEHHKVFSFAEEYDAFVRFYQGTLHKK